MKYNLFNFTFEINVTNMYSILNAVDNCIHLMLVTIKLSE